MRKMIALGLVVSLAAFVGIGLAQTNGRNSRQGILPPEAYLGDRSEDLEVELKRLKESEAIMGPSHPKLASVQKRIAECQRELETLQAIPNPIAGLDDEKVAPNDIVDQMSDKELRGLAIRLFFDLKDLRKRVDALERLNNAR
jgi:hypothetical protein